MRRSRRKRLITGLAIGGLLLVAACAGPEHRDGSTLRFADVAAEAGIAHVYTGGWAHFVGGGVAAFDCDNDGDTDLFFAGGENPAQLYRNETAGALAFAAVPASALALTGVTGAYPLDIDSDGLMDLAVLRAGENAVFLGRGDCRFVRANAALGFDGGDGWTTAFSATWEPGHRLPTLAVGNYVDRDDPDGPFNACDDNALFRPPQPNAARYGGASALTPGHCALSMLFSDWDRSGRASLRISNDRHYYVRDGEEQLWRMDATPYPYGRADGWQQLRIFGMGIASHDVTGDGYPDYVLTSMADNKLRTLTGGPAAPHYGDLAYARGVTAHRPHAGGDERPSTAWHAEFGDVDNDGRIDLFIAKGNVDGMAEAAAHDPNNLLMGQADGRFAERSVEARVASMAQSRGGALVDLDRDGKLDIVVVNRNGPVEIHHNRSTATGNWLQLRLVQPGPNRDAIGAWIEVRAGSRTWSHEVTIGGGHGGGECGWVHFGLGAARADHVTVRWPDGRTTSFEGIETNGFVTLTRPS